MESEQLTFEGGTPGEAVDTVADEAPVLLAVPLHVDGRPYAQLLRIPLEDGLDQDPCFDGTFRRVLRLRMPDVFLQARSLDQVGIREVSA